MRFLFLWLVVWCVQSVADAHLFVYHRFGDDRHPSTNIPTEKLREQFTYFKERGYKVVPLEDVVQRIHAKEAIPDTWVVLTIDDNYKSFYDNGLALFKEFGYPFTLFVYTGATQRGYGDYATWEQLHEIGKYGELAFHSHEHPNMTQLDDDALKKDFETGMALFEKHLGKKARYFSYPYGEYDERVKAIASSYDFEAIINQNMGAVSHQSDLLNLDRSALGENSNLGTLLSYRHLNAKWLAPKTYPKDSKLNTVEVEIQEKTKQAGLYITGLGWQEIPVEEGIIRYTVDQTLTHDRTRLILSVGKKISTHILIKDH
ncbi:polysaccharide deacetylase family protein [Sulfurospirillum sp. T05]|uniref:Polysaccharide deacetylase family protein n=1 Tax=Sulfurospirillum tamanense TaxID=2813362 RepID=A0ABS2WR76_9BACT|nr:polysaccharide deacetylase family protein [Sulfurospirillum tamanensis]MBN2964097.1 polysaccharide deacetylase family protein [Sulfurospirillum tamanensis]